MHTLDLEHILADIQSIVRQSLIVTFLNLAILGLHFEITNKSLQITHDSSRRDIRAENHTAVLAD